MSTEQKIQSLPLEHLSTILKYGGISFIAGAVNHGFFSGLRSLLTASLGVLFFLLGSFIDSKHTNSIGKEILFNLILSIGFGLFTGGLQHFPDSPARSAWVVPFGYCLTYFSLYRMRTHVRKKDLLIGVTGLAIVFALSFGLYHVFHSHLEAEPHSESHSHSDH